MPVDRIKTELEGHQVSFEYSEHWVGYSILGLRLTIGWILLQAGLQKLLNPSWTAAGYLNNVPAGNPLIPLWSSLAGVPLVDMLVIAGLTFTGFGILFGVLLRFSSFWASVMMALFWASSLKGGLMQGLPVAHGWMIDSHIVYIALLFGLAAFGSGRIMGIDRYLERQSFIKKHSRLKYLLG